MEITSNNCWYNLSALFYLFLMRFSLLERRRVDYDEGMTDRACLSCHKSIETFIFLCVRKSNKLGYMDALAIMLNNV